MDILIKINEYNAKDGLKLSWKGNYKIKASSNHGEIVIAANEEGLLSLANHLISLAQPNVPIGTHIHFDEYNSLEDGSDEVVIQKIEQH